MVGDEMTSSEIKKAKQLARDCINKDLKGC